MTLQFAARLSTVLVMAGVAIGALELLASRAILRADGFYSWPVLRTAHPWVVRRGSVAAVADTVFAPEGMVVVFVVQLGAAVLAILDVGPVAVWLVVALAGNMLLHVRNTYGLDGSDQMQSIVLASLVLYHLAPDDRGRAIALGFVAAQSLLSYLASGVAKLISPLWRGGSAIAGVLDTLSYGNAGAAGVLREHPGLARALCWATLVFECAMPLLVLTGPIGCLVFLAAGLAFHLGVAAMMGLNLFVWAFAATYPCVYLASTWL